MRQVAAEMAAAGLLDEATALQYCGRCLLLARSSGS
jgi:hypothetical protein